MHLPNALSQHFQPLQSDHTSLQYPSIVFPAGT